MFDPQKRHYFLPFCSSLTARSIGKKATDFRAVLLSRGKQQDSELSNKNSSARTATLKSAANDASRKNVAVETLYHPVIGLL